MFDENHPPALARMLAPLVEGEGYGVAHVVGLGLRGTPDAELLAAISAGGTRGVLVTADRAMRRRKHEKAAVAASGAVVVVGVANWNQVASLWDRARHMLWWWPTHHGERARRGSRHILGVALGHEDCAAPAVEGWRLTPPSPMLSFQGVTAPPIAERLMASAWRRGEQCGPEQGELRQMDVAPAGAVDWSRLSAAAAHAFSIHAGQTRKGTDIPYISHLLAVAALVLEHGGDQEQAVAGLLHDAIEDCGAEQEGVIREQFGPRVARIVRACTDADTFPKPPWRKRKERYLCHLEAVGPDALLVSCCDKLHNARAIVADLQTHGLALFDRFNAPREGTLWYYGALADRFLRRLPGPLSRELATAVAEMRRLGDLVEACPLDQAAHPANAE